MLESLKKKEIRYLSICNMNNIKYSVTHKAYRNSLHEIIMKVEANFYNKSFTRHQEIVGDNKENLKEENQLKRNIKYIENGNNTIKIRLL